MASWSSRGGVLKQMPDAYRRGLAEFGTQPKPRDRGRTRGRCLGHAGPCPGRLHDKLGEAGGRLLLPGLAALGFLGGAAALRASLAEELGHEACGLDVGGLGAGLHVLGARAHRRSRQHRQDRVACLKGRSRRA
jgi:hypothetical protein